MVLAVLCGSNRTSGRLIPLLGSFLLVSCAPSGIPEDMRPDIDWNVVVTAADPEQRISWREDVQPIVEQRCVVCHGCYDAPCQLKLTSYDGLMRGANPNQVYDGSRIRAAAPTRLGIDATTTAEWRNKGFHSVLGNDNPDSDASAADRLRESVLYKMLRLKQLNPQPRTGLLPDAMTLSLGRKQVCTKEGDMADYQRTNPLWGMPYAMPNLSDVEYQTIVGWLAEGAEAPLPVENSAEAQRQIARWEKFLNGATNRERLMSRYVYEHLFLGHMHFEGTPEREFYRLVRSTTAPGEGVAEIPTTRPFNDPGTDQFWYRLRRYDRTIVAKSHVVYPLSDAKLERYRELFLQPDYTVRQLPGYALPDAANPIKTFEDLPVPTRYNFMLDDARYFIQGFIKGPVCRGQVALNVIADQFWVMFLKPDEAGAKVNQKALNNAAAYLQMPSSIQTLRLLSFYRQNWKRQKEYLAARTRYLEGQMAALEGDVIDRIWDGDGTNPNAALTIFRNFDSAAVEYGLLGNYPETAWLIDYTLFERIHYLLVAGFDVYGNIGHQLYSRLFMDFLRMEAEDNFLLLLSPDDRKPVRDKWYQGMRAKRQKYFEEPMGWLDLDFGIEYTTDNPQKELYDKLITRIGPPVGGVDYLNRCAGDCESMGETDRIRQADAKLRPLTTIRGRQLEVFPDLAFIRVVVEGEDDIHYSLVYNKDYQNITSPLEDGRTPDRNPDNDTLTLIRGFSGSYPNFFFVVPFEDLDAFVAVAANLSSISQYHAFVGRWGVRRTNPEFWQQSDWFNARYAKEQPIEAGILDLNRYLNR
jgi:hypothetical protein